MAATISTYTLPVGFSRADVLTQLETIFSDLGYHAPGISGLITNLQNFSGGGSGSAIANKFYYNASSVTATGTGSGATFFVRRDSVGNVLFVRPNCPGQGYVTGDTVSIPASETGGTVNGATNITVTVNASTTVYGSPSTYFTKDLTRNDPWAVMRMEMDETKAYGFTYRGLYINTGNQLIFSVGSSFQPETGNDYNNYGGWGTGISYRGTPYLDCYDGLDSNGNRPFSFAQSGNHALWSSNSFPLAINVYRSNLDPDCTFISFYQPDLSSTNLNQNTFLVFSFNKYTTPLWDLDYVFQGGINIIAPNIASIGSGSLGITNYYYPIGIVGDPGRIKRMAEYGFGRTKSGPSPFSDEYNVNIFNDNYTSDPSKEKIYSRDSDYDYGLGDGPGAFINPAADYRAIIKGIPISGKIAPCPYYFPDEFVIIDFVITTPSQNIQPGDTVTVSPSEIYTVITGGYATDSTTNTRGVLFAVRST